MQTTEQDLKDFHKWVHNTAGILAREFGWHLYDDMVQEGFIKLWEILERKGGRENVSAPYLVMGMRSRMRDVALRKPQFGGDRRAGEAAKGRVKWYDSLDAKEIDIAAGEQDLLIVAHRDEIVDAVSDLTDSDKTYVYLRFWEGYGDTEIAKRLGRTNKYWHQHWRKVIQPKLAKELAHLESW